MRLVHPGHTGHLYGYMIQWWSDDGELDKVEITRSTAGILTAMNFAHENNRKVSIIEFKELEVICDWA